MTSLHWLILNCIAWIVSAYATIELQAPEIFWAPSCFTLGLIIAFALTENLKS